MLLRSIIPISVVLVGILFADVDASSSFPIHKTTSCGVVELQQCWCLEENPCDHKHKSKKIDPTDVIPIISKKNILTAKYIKNHIKSESPTELNLSGKKFEGIDRTAFDNFTDLKSLDLSNNNLSKLPAFIFSKLTNLEHLDLSGNGMKTTRKLFAGLNNLKTLVITKNPLNKVLEDNCFFGLTKSCEIYVTPESVKKLGTDAFGNASSTPFQDSMNEASNDEIPKAKSIHTRSLYWPITTFQICIQNNIVQRLDELKAFKKLKSGCQELDTESNQYNIKDLGIIDFEKGWFREQDENRVPYSLSALHITGNNMSRVTKNVVNDLPTYITWLEMPNNKIERLDSETFKHERIFSLSLTNNLISEIADNTFMMPKLYQLYLQGNRLKDTKFFATMPASLSSIDLSNNEITEIAPNSFSSLSRLSYLNLNGNKITTVASYFFHGTAHLGTIVLSNNKITKLEPGAFDNLRVGSLALDNNQISTIEKGVFNNLARIQHLSISSNKLKKILSGSFNVPNVERVDLSKNQITEMEKGAMKSCGRLNELNLSSNPISKLENGAFFGLNKTQTCHVLLDHSPVEIIQAGVFDDV